MFNFRTDLADERNEIYKKNNNLDGEVNGIIINERKIDKDLKVTEVEITNSNGEKAIGKPIGKYITIDINNLNIIDEESIEKSFNLVSEELKKLIGSSVKDVLVVGLGNISSTPDSLGPKVIKNIEVTKHIKKYLPQYIDENAVSVSAISPGVLGTTGIETLEIVEGVVEKTNPQMVIVIDSLASRSINRISKTIQICNTGIVPGAGVENKRKEISQKTLGKPVIAIGVPMVVESAVLLNDCLDLFIEKIQEEAKSNDYLNELKEKDNYEDIKEILMPKEYNMIVTPKEIDDLIDNMCEIVSNGINYAL